ncbi:CUEDC1 family protein [Megaselia abdita]
MSTVQLDFAQAMTDFKTMFPDMDSDVIEAILRANQGAVDATIDQLLQMSTDNQNEKLRNELDKSTENASGTEELLIDTRDLPDILLIDKTGSSQSPPQQHLPELLKTTRNTGASPKVKQPKENYNSKWKPPLLGPLPPDFLRITTDGRTEYDLPDEQFALMLQNEEFMNELRWNQEFMNALEKEQQEKGRNDVDDAAFKERLRHMGKVSRKKFLQMARVFTWQRRNKNKPTSAKQIDSQPLEESDDEDHHHTKK